ncbi:chemotaxis protein MotB [Rhodobacteraceae bacterium KMM 6894]|nr:chemotaxis protein MotB [Rhodobacteraceae bacterium KMM 6894]
MSAQNNAAPVIIKRKKVVAGGGHHGGAWKVAYADFVTAMMAFFLLMWLLNATTEKQRKGLADYFSPTVPIHRVSGGGPDSLTGDTPFSEDALPKNGVGASQHRATESNQARGATGLAVENDQELEELQRKIEGAMQGTNGESMISPELQRHIITRVTDEGLVVELFDRHNATLFEDGLDRPTALLTALAKMLAEMGGLISNPMAIEGHLQAAPVIVKDNPVWDISTTRALAMRRLLVREGMEEARMHRVTGHADRDPAVRNPMAVRNNRLEVIFLRTNVRN